MEDNEYAMFKELTEVCKAVCSPELSAYVTFRGVREEVTLEIYHKGWKTETHSVILPQTRCGEKALVELRQRLLDTISVTFVDSMGITTPNWVIELLARYEDSQSVVNSILSPAARRAARSANAKHPLSKG